MTSHLICAEATALLAGSARGGGVDLDFDMTFVLQMGVFASMVLILKPLLFDPLMKLFEEREQRTEGAKLLARRMDERAGELLRRYETELENVRKTAGEEREKLRAEGQRVEAQIVAEARAAAAKLVEDGRKALELDRKSLRGELFARADGIARDIAARVLEREIG